MSTTQIKQGADFPPLTVTLTRGSGKSAKGIDLTDAVVSLTARTPPRGLQARFGGAVQVVDAARGQVAYNWGEDDTAIPAVYFAEFLITYSTGAQETWPAGEYLFIDVLPDLEDDQD